MAVILHIESASTTCSCVLSNDGDVLFDKSSLEQFTHSSVLGLFVNEALSLARRENLVVEAVAISSGPGSYTGLRIGVSLAKGVCFGLGVPLISVSTHKIMASAALDRAADADLLCPMLDARRMEVYTAVFDKSLRPIYPVSADIIDENSFSEYLTDNRVLFFGDGADKCSSIIKSSNAFFIDRIFPQAKYMVEFAEDSFRRGQFEDIAYYEPFYMKNFIATTPKNKFF